MKVKEVSEKVGLKLNIQKTKIMPSDPIISWQIDVETMETVSDIILRNSQITANGDCSLGIKRCLQLGRKGMTNLNSVLKRRDITFLAKKVPPSQSYDFSSSHVCMWELDHIEGWVPNNWCFWNLLLEKALERPWTTRRSNQSIPKEISPEYSLEGLMLKLKLQCFGYLMPSAHSLEKTLLLGKTEGKTSRGQQRMRWLHGITGQEFKQTLGYSKGQGSLECCN